MVGEKKLEISADLENAMRHFVFLSLLAVFPMGCDQSDQNEPNKKSRLRSLQEPRPLPAEGPWFEGWYTRVTSTSSNESFALIVATILSEGRRSDRLKQIPGYVSVLHQTNDQPRVDVQNFFPESTHMTTGDGLPVKREPNPFIDKEFSWSSDGLAKQTDDRVEVTLPDGRFYRVQKLARHRGWDFEDLGPAGLASLLSFLPLQWYVHSTATPVSWELIDAQGERRSGKGLAHFEKNWGASFPQEWIWGQSVSKSEDAQLAFAGGPPPGLSQPLASLAPKVFLIGLRDGDEFHSFKPQEPGTVFHLESAPCSGKIRLLARTPTETIEILAEAPPSSFSALAVPTQDGFVDGAEESFRTDYHVNLYEHQPLEGLFGLGTLKKVFRFSGGALEFGGHARCERAGTAGIP